MKIQDQDGPLNNSMFSIPDFRLAQKLLEKKKVQVGADLNSRHNHPHIGMFDQCQGGVKVLKLREDVLDEAYRNRTPELKYTSLCSTATKNRYISVEVEHEGSCGQKLLEQKKQILRDAKMQKLEEQFSIQLERSRSIKGVVQSGGEHGRHKQ